MRNKVTWFILVIGALAALSFRASQTFAYDGSGAADYARYFCDKVSSDGWYMIGEWVDGVQVSSIAKEFPCGTSVGDVQNYLDSLVGEWHGVDCAHFVSCCVGNPAICSAYSGGGGGLDVPHGYSSAVYGHVSSASLLSWLENEGGGTKVHEGNNPAGVSVDGYLEEGDVIAYDWDENDKINHVALYLGNNKAASHSRSWCEDSGDWRLGHSDNFRYEFYHIPAESVQAPYPPSLIYPGSSSSPGPEINDLTPTFQWSSGANATDYGLYIRNLDTDILVFNSEEDYGTITGTQFTLPSNHALEYETQYRWNMSSHNSLGWSYDLGTGFSERLYFTTTVSDAPPNVNAFGVTPDSVTLDNPFSISYTVSDDIGLQQTELWRANDVGGAPDWDGTDNPIITTPLSGQTSYSSSFTDAPPSIGTYWYGMHVVDTSGQWSFEPDPPGPIQVTVTPLDSSPPTVDAFSVFPESVTLGNSFTISYTVSDDIYLNRAELWRANDTGGSPVGWAEIKRTSLSGTGPYVDSFYDRPTLVGTYWYGLHVVDNAGNLGLEPDPPGPIMVQVDPAPPTSTGWRSPSANGRRDNEWTDPEYAYSSDNQYAVANSWYSAQDWCNFGFNIPLGSTINGIEIKLEGTGDGIDYVGKVKCRVFRRGLAFDETDYLEFPATEDAFHTVGGSTDLWGCPLWSPEDFEDNADFPFVVRLTTGAEWHTAGIDHIQTQVYYTPLKGDINTDGKVDFKDFAILGAQWRQAPGEPSADIAPEGGDGLVDFLDLAALTEHWLEGTIP